MIQSQSGIHIMTVSCRQQCRELPETQTIREWSRSQRRQSRTRFTSSPKVQNASLCFKGVTQKCRNYKEKQKRNTKFQTRATLGMGEGMGGGGHAGGLFRVPGNILFPKVGGHTQLCLYHYY